MKGESQSRPVVAFDVGNTSVKAAVLDESGPCRVGRVPTQPVEDLARRLAEGLPRDVFPPGPDLRCVACSVFPEAGRAVAAFWRGLDGTATVEFFGSDVPAPMPSSVAEPLRVGTDRLLLALGAREQHGEPCIVVSAGTAITVDVVGPDGAFAGGAIAPGFGLSAAALHEGTAQLPLVAPHRPSDPVGGDTQSALASGIYWSCAGGVLALVQLFRGRPGCAEAQVVCTGTDAPLLLPALPDALHEPDLIFHGMAAALSA